MTTSRNGAAAPQPVLGLSRAPHVVTERHRYAEPGPGPVPEREVAPAQVLREDSDASLVVDVAGHQESSRRRADIRVVKEKSPGKLADPGDHGVGGPRAVDRRGNPHQITHAADLIYEGGLHVRAAHVERQHGRTGAE